MKPFQTISSIAKGARPVVSAVLVYNSGFVLVNIFSGKEPKHCGVGMRGLRFEAWFCAFFLSGTGLGSAIRMLQISSGGACSVSILWPSRAIWHVKDCRGRRLGRFFYVENEKEMWVSTGVAEQVHGSMPHGHVHESTEGWHSLLLFTPGSSVPPRAVLGTHQMEHPVPVLGCLPSPLGPPMPPFHPNFRF